MASVLAERYTYATQAIFQRAEKSRKTLEDFPKFHLTRVTRCETDPKGFTTFEFEGRFDRPVEQSGEITWFWLLIGDHAAVCMQWKSLDKETRAAVVIAREMELPDLSGKTLYYLSPRWNALNIWMVLDERWGWERMRFQAVDAVAEDYEAKEVSIVDGREVKKWTKLERADKRRSSERYYPVTEESPPSGADQRIIPGGWDHEHCELCHEHIDHGDFGYRDRDERWLCEKCYDRYVSSRDLSFVDEL